MNTNTWQVRIFIFALDQNTISTSPGPAFRYSISLPDPSRIDSLQDLEELIYGGVLDAAVAGKEPIAKHNCLSGMRIDRMNALTIHAGEMIHLMVDADNPKSVLAQIRRNGDACQGEILSLPAEQWLYYERLGE